LDILKNQLANGRAVVKFGEKEQRRFYRSQLETLRSALGEGLDANENIG